MGRLAYFHGVFDVIFPTSNIHQLGKFRVAHPIGFVNHNNTRTNKTLTRSLLRARRARFPRV